MGAYVLSELVTSGVGLLCSLMVAWAANRLTSTTKVEPLYDLQRPKELAKYVIGVVVFWGAVVVACVLLANLAGWAIAPEGMWLHVMG